MGRKAYGNGRAIEQLSLAENLVIICGHDAPKRWRAGFDRHLTGPTEDQGMYVAGARGGPCGDTGGVGVP